MINEVIVGFADMLRARPEFAATPGGDGVQILDGPDPTFTQAEAIAVGAALEDPGMQVVNNTSGGPGAVDAVGFSLSSIIWAGSGVPGAFATHRARVEAIYAVVVDTIESDRTLRGAVSTTWVTGSSLTQQPLGTTGSLVVLEFRISANRF